MSLYIKTQSLGDIRLSSFKVVTISNLHGFEPGPELAASDRKLIKHDGPLQLHISFESIRIQIGYGACP